MSDVEEARAQIREIIRELIRLLFCLLGIAAALPVSPQEVSAHDLLERDLGLEAQMRARIQNTVNDRLRPMIEDLQSLVERPPSPD